MKIGVPKEIKPSENRAALTPSGAAELISGGHEVIFERSMGTGSGFADAEYIASGAEMAERARVFAEADLILKVKEPVPEEYPLLLDGGAIFTYLHLAPNPGLTKVLLEKNISAFAYETLEDGGGLPLLKPMSEIAGSMSPIMASWFLQSHKGGLGLLPSGASGVRPVNVSILGAGIVGTSAARVALALGMNVTVLSRGAGGLKRASDMFGGNISTLTSTPENISSRIAESEVLIGAALVSGERAPKLVSREMLKSMKKGSVIVDVSIDQGGCFETSHPTAHEDPVFVAEGVIHYCVSNMPGAYPRTSTLALASATMPYIKRLASMGADKAFESDPALRTSLNIYKGRIVHPGLARSIGD